MKTMWLRWLFFFTLVNAAVFASTLNFTLMETNSWVSGGGATSAILSSSEVGLTYNYVSGGYSGMNVYMHTWPWTPATNFTPYKRLVLDVRSDSEQIDLFLVDSLSSTSKRYHLSGLNGSQYKTIEINLNSFQNVDLSQILNFKFTVDASGSTYRLFVKNIFLDQNEVSSTFNVLLIDRLVASGNLSAGAYPSMANYRRELQHLWKGYKYHFVEKYQSIVPSSVYGMIFDPGTNNIVEINDYTTSEASGYGLLISLYMNDQAFFDTLLDKTWTIMAAGKATNLPAWKVNANGTIADVNSATDADGDIATALMFADILVQKGFWTNTGKDYSTKAQTLIHQYMINDLEYKRYIRLGDYYNGGRLLTNPSYFSPAWYKDFSLYENQSHDWNPLLSQGYATIAANPGYLKGLVPDWCNSWGEVSVQKGYDGYNMAWEAIRTYWRLALDKVWFNEPKAGTYLSQAKDYLTTYKVISAMNFMTLAGADMYGPKLALDAMMAAGALGSGDSAYISNWKSVFDGYLYYSGSEKYSFLAKDYDTTARYDYFGQSLGLLSALFLSGAMPNILTVLVSPNSAPSLVASHAPSRLHNQSVNKIGLQFSSTGGASYIGTVDIKQLFTGGAYVQFALPKSSYPSLSIVDGSGVIKDASWEYAVTGSVMSVTLSYVISCNWVTDNSVSTYWNATDVKQNKQSGWQTLGGLSTFYPYPADYLSQVTLNISMGEVSASARYVYYTVTNAIQMSAADPSWNIRAFSDQIVSESGSAGLARKDASGNILQVLPVKMLLTTNAIVFPAIPDATWLNVYDRQDTTSSVLLRGQTPAARGTYQLGLVVDKLGARQGAYEAMLYLELNQGSTTKVDSFEFPDSRMLSAFSTDWGSLAQNSGTLTNISRQGQGLMDSHVLSLSYTLGVLEGNRGPQSMAFIDLKQHQQIVDLSVYKGIRFWIKTQTNAPIGLVIAATSSVITDYDDFLYPIHPLPNQWICYTLYFNQFRQAGWGHPASLSSAIANTMTIQFKSLSDRTGEQQTIWLDEIELFK